MVMDDGRESGSWGSWKTVNGDGERLRKGEHVKIVWESRVNLETWFKDENTISVKHVNGEVWDFTLIQQDADPKEKFEIDLKQALDVGFLQVEGGDSEPFNDEETCVQAVFPDESKYGCTG